MAADAGELKSEGPVQPHTYLSVGGIDNHRRTPVDRQIGRDVEVGQRCVDIGVDHAEHIHPDKAYYAEVAVAAIEVSPCAHCVGEPFLVEILFLGG